MFGDMQVIGSCSYPTSTWSASCACSSAGLVDFSPLVTHRFPAERFEDAFRVLDDREGVVAKVLLEHPAA